MVCNTVNGYLLWICIIIPGAPEPLLKTYGPPRTDAVPTSLDFVSTEPQQVFGYYLLGKCYLCIVVYCSTWYNLCN